MTGEVVDAARAEQIGLVTEVVPHDRLLPRAVELAGQIAEVPAPIMAGLKDIYVTGAAATTDAALAAEQAIAGAQMLDQDGLHDRYMDAGDAEHSPSKELLDFRDAVLSAAETSPALSEKLYRSMNLVDPPTDYSPLLTG